MPNSKRLKVEMRLATEEEIEERAKASGERVRSHVERRDDGTKSADELALIAKYPLARRLGDGNRPPRRRIVLEEIKEGVTTLTAFAPEDVLFEVWGYEDRPIRYTVQDMLDEVGKMLPPPQSRFRDRSRKAQRMCSPCPLRPCPPARSIYASKTSC